MKRKENKRAIADCGWNPLNCNILCLPEIVGSMIEEDINNDEIVEYKAKSNTCNTTNNS